MAGTCVTTIKVIGLSSIGLLTSSLTYQSTQQIPKLINEINLKLESGRNHLQYFKINKFVNFGILTSIVSCLTLVYKYSPNNEKHPYLLYSIFGSIIGFGYTYYNSWVLEQKLHNQPLPSTPSTTDTSEVKPAVTEKKDDDLSKSYIHVSEEESSTNSTPNQLTPNSPKVPVEPVGSSIDEEINLTLFKKQMINDLTTIGKIYLKGSYIFGFTFLISSIGIIGDLFR